MATILQLRRGTTVQHSSFTGAVGEVTVDTTKDTIVVHDGTTAGGFPLAKESDIAGFISLSDLSGGTGLDYNSSTGVFDIDSTVATKTYVDNAIQTKDNSDEITEGTTNLYFTNARARGAVSVTDSGGDGSLSYNSTTGVITYTGPSSSEVRAHFSAGTGITITNGAIATSITQYTDALARAAVSAGTGLSYNSTTGVFTNSITQYTDALARAAISAGTGISYNSTTGVVSSSITQYTDALARAAVSVTDSGGDGSLSYNSTTGVITYTGPSSTEVRAHFSAGTGVTISSGQISIGQAVGTTSNVTFNDLTVSGNLTVSGTTTTVNTETINLADNIITLNSNETGSPTQNAGIEIERGTATNVAFQWNETNDIWEYTVDGTNYIPIVGTTATQTLTNKTISGASNTLSNIGNSSLTNSKVTIGSTDVSLGATVTTFTGLTSVTATTFVGALTGNASTVTNGVYTTDTGTVTNTMLAGSIANAKLVNSSITVNGSAISLGGSATIKASTTNALTIGTGLSGTSFDGGSAVTIAIDSSVVTLTGSQTLTNKTLTLPTIGGTGAVFNGSTSGTTTVLASATAGTTTITLPATTGTVVTTGDTGTVTNTMLAGSIANAKLANSTITLAGTSVSLGGSFTATNMLDAIKTVDGTGSGLDADLLDGQSSAYFRINIYDAAGTLLN